MAKSHSLHPTHSDALEPDEEVSVPEVRAELKKAKTAKGSEPVEAVLSSGSVDEDGKLTAVDASGKEHKLEPGSFEALGNDRVRFTK